MPVLSDANNNHDFDTKLFYTSLPQHSETTNFSLFLLLLDTSILLHQLVIYTTSSLLRWRFSLSIHYCSIRTSTPYRYPSLSAEPIEAVSRNLNLPVEPSDRDCSSIAATMSIEIVPLSRTDIPDAVECVQRAFADDPYFRWAFDDPTKVRNVTPCDPASAFFGIQEPMRMGQNREPIK